MKAETWIVGAAVALGLVAIAMTSSSSGSLRHELVKRAARDVDVVKEQGGKNTGPEIDRYLAAVHEAPGANWCAAGLSAWLRDAYAAIGRLPPFQLVSGAKLLGRLMRMAPGVAWLEPALVSRLNCPEGTVVVWDRSNPPFSSFEGHIGVLESWLDENFFHSIEANSGATGDRVARMVRDRRDPRLVGAAIL